MFQKKGLSSPFFLLITVVHVSKMIEMGVAHKVAFAEIGDVTAVADKLVSPPYVAQRERVKNV